MFNIIQYFRDNKAATITFIFVFLFITITGVLVIVSLSKPTNQTSSNTIPTPSPNVAFSNIAPSPAVAYNREDTKKMLDILKNRPKLSDSDQKIRDSLISSSDKNSDVLNQTNDYNLEYISVPDEFMAEIKTTDLEKGKQETVDWLKSKGLSQNGVCNLPLVFYINFQIAQELRNSNVSFDPLPAGC